MTDATLDRGTSPGFPTTEAGTFRDLARDACLLASVIEALDALREQADGPDDCMIVRRARNGMGAVCETAINAALQLAARIEDAGLR